MAVPILDAFVRFLADTTQLKPGLEKGAGAAADSAGTKAGNAFATKMGTAVGAVAGSLFVGAIGGATNFEEQLRIINTVARVTDDELDAIGKGIVELSKETGKNTADLTAGYYDLVSAGVPVEDALNVLRDSAILATGALGTTGEAVDLVTSALNAYGLSADQSTRVTDIFAQAVADGKVTASELGASIANIAPVAASGGIAIEEVAAGFAVLTANGTPATQAATQMRAAISALLTPNAQLNALQEKTGINFAELAAEKGLSVALDTLRTATEENGTALDKLAGVTGKDFPRALKAAQEELGLTNSQVDKFIAIAGKDGAGAAMNELVTTVGEGDSAFAKSLGSIEAYQFGLQSTGDAQADFAAELERVNTAAEDGGVALGQYDEVQKSAAARGRKLQAGIAALGIEIGGPFVDSLGPAVVALGGVGHGLSGIFSLSRLAGGGLGALAGRGIPKLVKGLKTLLKGDLLAKGLTGGAGLIGKIVPALMGLIPALASTLATVGTAIGGAIAAAIPIGMALLPFILIGALVAAIAVLIFNPEIREKVFKFVGEVIENIGKFLGEGLGKIGEFLGDLPGILGEALGSAIRFAGTVIFDYIPKIAGFILGIPGKLVGLAVDMGEAALGAMVEFGKWILDGVDDAVAWILDIPARLSDFANLMGDIGEAAANALKFPFQIAADFIQGVIDGINGKTTPPKINNTGLFSQPRPTRPALSPTERDEAATTSRTAYQQQRAGERGYAMGTSFVPEDMVAQLHRGEIVLTRDEARAYRAGTMQAEQFEPQAGGSGTTLNMPFQGLLPVERAEDVIRPLRQLAQTGWLPGKPRLAIVGGGQVPEG